MKLIDRINKIMDIKGGNIRSIVAGGLSLVFGGMLLSSCADELDVRNALPFTEENALIINIPNVEGAAQFGASRSDFSKTRAQNETSEARIHDNQLWFFAYPVNSTGATDSSRPTVITKLTSANQIFTESGSEYSQYKISELENGNYHIYVTANIDDYADKKPSTIISESDLRHIILNFSTTEYPVAGKLPMACLNTEIKKGPSNGSVTDGLFNFGSTGSNNIYADLTFLCAKVRYTILFDNSSSSAISGNFTKSDVDFTGAKVSNIREQSAFCDGNPNQNQSLTLADNNFARPHTKVTYPSAGSEFLKDKPTAYADDLEKVNEWTPATQRAWQGTLYVPVNELNGDKKTKITFTATGSEVKDSYELPLMPNSGLEKGKFYDVVARLISPEGTTFDVSANVTDWTTQQLVYDLHGPYELIVETTEVPISSTKPAIFWYHSDIPYDQIRFDYPKITYTENRVEKKDVNFYVASIYKDENENPILNDNGEYQIEVKVNPAIPFSVIDDVEKNRNNYQKSDYMYFYVIAGNLNKMIKVTPLDLSASFKVTPKEIYIDVRQYITSGINNTHLNILVETNVTNDIVMTPEINGLFNSSQAMYFSGGTGIEDRTINSNGSFKLIDGSGHVRLNLAKLFDGDSWWKEERSFDVKFETASGDMKETITITIKPYTTDYILHFKMNNANALAWNNPHIYIYQCLQLPSDIDTKGKKNNVDTPVAGMTVGYGWGSDSKGSAQAALEYAFTNNVAFRGWSGYGGTVGIVAGKDISDGFYKMDGASDGKNDKFNPSYGEESIYNYSVDLNSAHSKRQSYWGCPDCRKYDLTDPSSFNGGKGGHIFPGVSMEPEGNGWWKYTLTGVATPGKAMIMFNNLHSGAGDDSKGLRYPKHNEVGVPLFDFPNNEGWFLYDGKSERHNLNFYDTKPKSIQYARFYWKNGGSLVHLWRTSGNSTTHSYTEWNYGPNTGIYDSATGYYFYEFPYTSGGNLNYNIRNSGAGEKSFAMSSFNESNGYCVYIDNPGDAVKGGKPGSGGEVIDPDPTGQYRIFWPQTLGSRIYIWTSSGTKLTGEYNKTDNENTGIHTLSNYYYKDFEYSGGDSSWNYIFISNTGNREKVNFTEFTTVMDGRKCAFITRGDWSNNNGDIHSGIPEEKFYVGDLMRITWNATAYSNNYFCMYIEYPDGSYPKAKPGFWNGIDKEITGGWPYLTLDFTIGRDCTYFKAIENNNENQNHEVQVEYKNQKNSFDSGRIKYTF